MANGQTNISGGKTLVGTAQPSDVRMGMTYPDGKELRSGTLDLANLTPENIKSGVTIGGVAGGYKSTPRIVKKQVAIGNFNNGWGTKIGSKLMICTLPKGTIFIRPQVSSDSMVFGGFTRHQYVDVILENNIGQRISGNELIRFHIKENEYSDRNYIKSLYFYPFLGVIGSNIDQSYNGWDRFDLIRDVLFSPKITLYFKASDDNITFNGFYHKYSRLLECFCLDFD